MLSLDIEKFDLEFFIDLNIEFGLRGFNNCKNELLSKFVKDKTGIYYHPFQAVLSKTYS